MIFLLIYIIFTAAFMHGFIGCVKEDPDTTETLTKGEHFQTVFFSIFTFPFLLGIWFYCHYKNKASQYENNKK